MCELGYRLRQAREEQGLDLTQLAERLKVRRAILEALEECRYQELPEPPLARGYLKRYAQALGLDPQPLLMLYPASPGMNRTVEVPPKSRIPTRTPRRAWLWVLPLLAILAAAAFWWYSTRQEPRGEAAPVAPVAPAPKQVMLRVNSEPAGARVYLDGFLLGNAPIQAPVEVGERVLRVEAQGYAPKQQTLNLLTDQNLTVRLEVAKPPAAPQATPPAGTTPAPTAQPSGNTLVLRVEQTSWIRVTTLDGRQLYEGTARPGTQLSFPLPVNVRTGNGGGVRAVVQGQDRGLMGGVGQVVQRRFGNAPASNP